MTVIINTKRERARTHANTYVVDCVVFCSCERMFHSILGDSGDDGGGDSVCGRTDAGPTTKKPRMRSRPICRPRAGAQVSGADTTTITTTTTATTRHLAQLVCAHAHFGRFKCETCVCVCVAHAQPVHYSRRPLCGCWHGTRCPCWRHSSGMCNI